MGGQALSKKLKNPHGLKPEFLKSIGDFFGPLDEIDKGLVEKIGLFVVDGEEEDFLLSLAGNRKAADKLGYVQPAHYDPNGYKLQQELLRRRYAVLDPANTAPPVVWMRLAEVLEAIARASGSPSSFPPEFPGWLGTLMMETGALSSFNANYGKPNRWPLPALEPVLIEAGLAPDLMVLPLLGLVPEGQFRTANYYTYQGHFRDSFLQSVDYYQKHYPAVDKALKAGNSEQRVAALEVLTKAGFDFSLVTATLVQLACSSSKNVREQAMNCLTTCKQAARPHFEALLKEGAASERNEAALALWRWFGAEVAQSLLEHAEHESAERVKQTINKLVAAKDAASCSTTQIELPPVDVPLGVVPLSPEAKEQISTFVLKAHESYRKQQISWIKRMAEQYPGRPLTQTPLEPLKSENIEKLIAFIEGTQQDPNWVEGVAARSNIAGAWPPSGSWLTPPAVQLVHIVRFDMAVQWLTINRHNSKGFWWNNQRLMEAYRSNCSVPFGLREVDHAVASLPGSSAGFVAQTYLTNNNKWYTFCDWEPEAIWPLFAENMHLLKEVLMQVGGDSTKRANAFKVLSMFPHLPGEFVPLVWDIALGEAKTERKAAQEALKRLPDKAQKIIVSLKDGRQSVRSAAAEWLGTIGDTSAIEPLKEAFKKEKNEIAKGIILLALDSLHANVDEFLNRDELLKEAQTGMKKTLPKGMEWVPLDNLPKLHWEDTGKQVDPAIVQWWIVQSITQKSAVCSPILKKYLSMCKKKDASSFAKYVLATWIARDTATPPPEQAAEKARAEADSTWAKYSSYPQWAEHYKNDKENLYKALYQTYSSELLYSANDQKGMLAIASAAGDADCVKLAEQYIRKYYGYRLAQCKALVDLLAWLDNPLALQVLLSIANRFRTKSIREAAQAHVSAIADRQGWTIDELSDRTIPDAGFQRPEDETGQPIGTEAILELDYGPRQFEVRLNDELEPVICVKGEAKPLKAPPAPAKSDDEEKAKWAKKVFSDAKKIVKEVVKRQSERLYEALCTQRAWNFSDWFVYLAQHPIVGKLCTRLVWTAYDNSGTTFTTCFRPLEDGTLTNEADEEVKLPQDARILVAHSCNIPSALEEAWLKHLTDYDVTPLFSQFGKVAYNLSDERKKETELKDFEGHCITTFKLRGKATKLGYTRSEAEDGGCFYQYRKPFVSLAMQAVVEFTGSYLPESDIPAALTSFYFESLRADQPAWSSTRIPLEKVPAVLLTECYNDIRLIAKEGSGFDPKWREKSLY